MLSDNKANHNTAKWHTSSRQQATQTKQSWDGRKLYCNWHHDSVSEPEWEGKYSHEHLKEKKLKNDIIKLLRSLFVFVSVFRQHKNGSEQPAVLQEPWHFDLQTHTINLANQNKAALIHSLLEGKGVGGGCFHFTCGHFSLAGSPLAKQEMQSVLFMKSLYFPLLFVRNHFHTRHVFPIVLTCLEILVFTTGTCRKGETDTRVGSQLFPACVRCKKKKCGWAGCDKCAAAFLNSGVSYLCVYLLDQQSERPAREWASAAGHLHRLSHVSFILSPRSVCE